MLLDVDSIWVVIVVVTEKSDWYNMILIQVVMELK